MTTTRRLSRRRVLNVMAAVGGLAAVPAAARKAAGGGMPAHRWRGVALGAEASLTLYHPDAARARELIDRAVAEIRRLEAVFSLYRFDSALSVLNREGRLKAPPLELVRLLAEAKGYGTLTGGAFDVTVQPLWRLYSEYFRQPGADPAGPAAHDIAQALARIDYRAVEVAGDRIAFARPGMAVTLNGIAQGYITDRVAELLRAGGLDNVLVDLGEIRGLGGHPDGRPWSVGIKDPAVPGRIAETLALGNRAIATSAGAGTRFDAAGRNHHLFDPKTGRSTRRYASVSVIAAQATRADALSTAFSAMDEKDIAAVLAGMADTGVVLLHTETRVPTFLGFHPRDLV